MTTNSHSPELVFTLYSPKSTKELGAEGQLLPLLEKDCKHAEHRHLEEGTKAAAPQQRLNIFLICCLKVKFLKKFPNECYYTVCA